MASPKTRRRNARGSGDRLRSEIVEGALGVVDDREGLTLTSIAGRVGIAAPSIYPHFSGVEEIRFEVIKRCYEDLISAITQVQSGSDDPVTRLEQTCSAYLRYAAEHPGRYSLLFQAERDRREKEAVGDHGQAALGTLVEAITACRAAGISASTDSYRDALAIWSAIHGLATLRAGRPDFSRLHDEGLPPSMIRRLALIDGPSDGDSPSAA